MTAYITGSAQNYKELFTMDYFYNIIANAAKVMPNTLSSRHPPHTPLNTFNEFSTEIDSQLNTLVMELLGLPFSIKDIAKYILESVLMDTRKMIKHRSLNFEIIQTVGIVLAKLPQEAGNVLFEYTINFIKSNPMITRHDVPDVNYF